MKKFRYNLGSLFLIIGFCFIYIDGNSQNANLTRQEQKEARRTEMVVNFQGLNTLLERKNFVLEADFLQNQYGTRINVTPMLNFIKIDSTHVVLQTGSNYGPGFNGVGGVTAEGRIERWEIVRNIKNLSYYIQFSVLTNIGIYDVSMSINSDNYAQATISGLRAGKLIYQGHIEPLDNSIVFKGQNTI